MGQDKIGTIENKKNCAQVTKLKGGKEIGYHMACRSVLFGSVIISHLLHKSCHIAQ